MRGKVDVREGPHLGTMSTRPALARLTALSVVCLTLVLSLCLGEAQTLGVGDDAPDFTVLDVDDRPHNLTDYRGRVLVIDFFATWCGPCANQLSVMKDLRDELPTDKVAFLMIDIDDRESREAVSAYRDSKGIGWPVAYGGDDVGDDYDVEAIPTTVVVDAEGVVQYYHVGITSKTDLKVAISELL